MIVMALALKIKHSIHDVLQRLRPGNRAFLRHVADEEDRNPAILGEHQELSGDFPDLRDRAGSRFDAGGKDRLNRINDDDVGLL